MTGRFPYSKQNPRGATYLWDSLLAHRYIFQQHPGDDFCHLLKHGMLFALLRDLDVPHSIAAEDACAIEHNISPETYSALKQLLKERQTRV